LFIAFFVRISVVALTRDLEIMRNGREETDSPFFVSFFDLTQRGSFVATLGLWRGKAVGLWEGSGGGGVRGIIVGCVDDD
jgi:hypothetical protein